MAQSISQEAIGATGLPGATAASRHAGATTSGAPTTGTFAVGDYVVDQTGAMYVCTVAGTPGTWQLSGVSVNENIAGKNLVINGGMDIWQRGTSFANLYNTYTADRWQNYSGVTGITLSQVASGLTGFSYALRSQRNSGGTSTGTMYVGQSLESVNSIPFAGKTATFSFYARCGSNFSPTGSQITATLQYGTGTDNNIYSGFTGGTAIVTAATTLTTSWQRFTYTATFASTSTQIGFYFSSVPTGTAGANDYFDITGVQLEIAPQATPFSRAGGSIGGELALCQRYYWQVGAGVLCPAVAISTSNLYGYVYTPVSMRLSPPTVTAYTLVIQNAGFTGYSSVTTASSLSISNGSSNIVGINFTSNVTSYSVGSNNWISQNNGSSYLSLSAEL